MKCRFVGLLAALAVLGASTASAQPAVARLLVTVVDVTGAVLPGASVTAVGTDDTVAETIAPVQSSAQGVATIGGLRLGRYTIQAELQSFQTSTLTNIVLRAGDNRHVIVLPLQKLQDSLTVAQDRQVAAADARGTAFSTAVTSAEVAALSDDPTELQQQLLAMAGPNAVIRVDSFEGAALPPKSQIRSIHITRDGFAAENHNPNAFFVDIITQPGIGPIRGTLNVRSRSGEFSGRNELTQTKSPEHTDDLFANIGGGIIKNKGSFSLFLARTTSYDTPVVNAVLANGSPLQALGIQAPQDRWQINGLFDYALTRDQTLRFGYFQQSTDSRNLGVGGFDLPDRAYSQKVWNRGFNVQETGPISRRMFLNTRLNVSWANVDWHAASEAPTIRVNDAFTSGGAQITGGRHSGVLTLLSDLDYIRGIHSVRTGILFSWNYYHADADTNYLGTYTFDSLAAFQAGRPANYSQRLGNPYVEYGGPIGGIYIQDDIRLSKSLTLSPGLRYEEMIHIDKLTNFGPRFGVTWAPFKSGRTTLRASSGIFYDYFGAENYEQTIRLNGISERQVNLNDPPFPNPGIVGPTFAASDRYIFADEMAMPRNMRLAAGIDQTVSPKARFSLQYSYVRGDSLYRGLNLNAPVAGVRPDPSFANVIQVSPDAATRQHQLTTTVNLNLSSASPSPLAGGLVSGPRIDWRRLTFNGTYTLASLRNNSDGTWSVPAGALADDWGPAPNDVRHRAFVSMNNQILRNFIAVVTLTATSGTPYNIRTGADDNGDGIFNDRPGGVGRNSERTPAQWFLNGNFVYTIPLGRQPGIVPPGGIGVVQGAPGTAPTVVTAPRPAARYRVQIGVNAQNFTNHANLIGYSGVMTSPFFAKPTTVANLRKVDFFLNFSF